MLEGKSLGLKKKGQGAPDWKGLGVPKRRNKGVKKKNQTYILTMQFKNNRDKGWVWKVSREEKITKNENRVDFGIFNSNTRCKRWLFSKYRRQKKSERRVLYAAWLPFECEGIVRFPILCCPREEEKETRR